MCRSRRELMMLQSLSRGRRCLVASQSKRARFDAEEEMAAAEFLSSSRAAKVYGHIQLKPWWFVAEFRKGVSPGVGAS